VNQNEETKLTFFNQTFYWHRR